MDFESDDLNEYCELDEAVVLTKVGAYSSVEKLISVGRWIGEGSPVNDDLVEHEVTAAAAECLRFKLVVDSNMVMRVLTFMEAGLIASCISFFSSSSPQSITNCMSLDSNFEESLSSADCMPCSSIVGESE